MDFGVCAEVERDAVALDLWGKSSCGGWSKRVVIDEDFRRDGRDVLVTLVEAGDGAAPEDLPVIRGLYVDVVVFDADLLVGIVSRDSVEDIGIKSAVLSHTEATKINVVEAIFGQVDGLQHQPEYQNRNPC